MKRYTPAQKRAIDKYRAEKVDRVEVVIPSGRKEIYKKAAEASGKSLNRFIVDSIEAALPKDLD